MQTPRGLELARTVAAFSLVLWGAVGCTDQTVRINSGVLESLANRIGAAPTATPTATPTIEPTATPDSTSLSPSLGNIDAQNTNEDDVKTISLFPASPDGPLSCSASNLSYASSNHDVVGSSHAMSWNGTWPNCTATVNPLANAYGNSDITITISNGPLTASQTFTLTVLPVNDAPTISDVLDLTTHEDVALNNIAVTIGDIDNTLTCSALTGTSDNQSLLPNSNINLSGTYPNCNVSVTPAANQNGIATVTLTVSDGILSAQDTFALTVAAVTDAPTLASIGDQITEEDTPKIINITAADVEGPLTCSASNLLYTSSNPAVVASSNAILWAGVWPACTATVNSVTNANGNTDITITISDGTLTASQTFTLTVIPANDAPTISNVASRSTNEDVSLNNIAVTIADIDGALPCSAITVTSSNITLLPAGNSAVTGTYPDCKLALTPAANQNGSATVTLTVSDGSLSAQSSFTLTVTAVNDAPTIAAVSNAETFKNLALNNVSVIIGDPDSTLNCSALKATSNNPTLLPNANITVAGVYPNCTLNLKPGTNQIGSATVTLTVSDGPLSTQKTFLFTVGMPLIYVAANGTNTASGFINSPLQTLDAARLKIKSLKAAGVQDPITVLFREGDYPIRNTVAFSSSETGTPAAPIQFKAYPGERVRFLGGEKISFNEFTPIESESLKQRLLSVEARDKVLQVDLKAKSILDYGQIYRRGYGLSTFFPTSPAMELFMNGIPQTLSRWPNDSDVAMDKVLDPGPLEIPATLNLPPYKIYAEKNLAYAQMVSHLTGGALVGPIPGPLDGSGAKSPDFLNRGGKFSHTYDRPAYWNTQGSDIWITGIFSYSWMGSYNKVESIDKAAKTVTLRYGEASGMIKTWYPDNHHYENIFEELDMPGEYYIDRTNGVLYFYPPADFSSSSEISLSTLSTPMITINGASNITFKDLIFSTGRSDAILQWSGNGNRFVNIEILGFAGNAIQIKGGTDNGIISSHIHHVGHRGVLISGGTFTTLTPGNNFLESSRIHDNAYYNKTYNAAVEMGWASVGNRISNNLIYNTPHVAIYIYGGDHLFEKNEIHHVSLEFSDMGAIYMNNGTRPGERGHIFRNNYFHDISLNRRGVSAIYPDEQSQGITAEGNIFYKIKSDGVYGNAAAYIAVRNNIFVDVTTPFKIGYGSFGARDYTSAWNTYFAQYNFSTMPHGTKYPELLLFQSQGANGRRDTPFLNSFTNNLIFNPTIPLSEADGIYHPNKPILRVENNAVVKTDPGFIDWANGNFGVKAGVDLKNIIPGFVDIPFESIGIGK
jgi:hypothetical protein